MAGLEEEKLEIFFEVIIRLSEKSGCDPRRRKIR